MNFKDDAIEIIGIVNRLQLRNETNRKLIKTVNDYLEKMVDDMCDQCERVKV